MSSKLSTFICQNCGTETSQYFGKCLNCNSWNSIVEEIKNKSSKYQDKKNSKKSIPFDEISLKGIDFLLFLISWCLDLLIFISSTMEFHELQLRHLPKY